MAEQETDGGVVHQLWPPVGRPFPLPRMPEKTTQGVQGSCPDCACARGGAIVMNSLEWRFWHYTSVQPDGCWEWFGTTNNDGYGRLGRGHDEVLLAHRISWMIHYGEIPENFCVLHHCDNPPCVRPDHLFLGTKGDNNQDMAIKGRHGKSKLSTDAVIEIRKLRGFVTRRDLADVFKVSVATVQQVQERRTWKYVPIPSTEKGLGQ